MGWEIPQKGNKKHTERKDKNTKDYKKRTRKERENRKQTEGKKTAKHQLFEMERIKLHTKQKQKKRFYQDLCNHKILALSHIKI